MKNLLVILEDHEARALAKLKKDIQSTSWRSFILELADNYEQTHKEKP